MATKKYYVVWVGRKCGIFQSWDECKEQIHEFSRASYKSFESFAEAEHAFRNGKPNYPSSKGRANEIISQKPIDIAVNSPDLTRQQQPALFKNPRPLVPSLAVDAACSGNPGAMEYRGVDTASKRQYFHYGPAPCGTNNIGEFLAIVHGLAYLKKRGLDDVPIYSDSVNAIKWVKKKTAKTTLERNPKTAGLFDMIDRAVAWLNNNQYNNPVLKWETDIWGECPADFGRK